jgi:hypothetical protein
VQKQLEDDNQTARIHSLLDRHGDAVEIAAGEVRQDAESRRRQRDRTVLLLASQRSPTRMTKFI